MKKSLLSLIATGVGLAAAGAAPAQVNAPATAEAQVATGAIPDEYICVFNASVTRANARAEASRAVTEQAGQLRHVYENVIRGFSARLPAQAMQRMRARNPNIAYCEQDQVVKALVQGRPGTVTASSTQTVPWGIQRVGAVGATYTSNAIAWVIDSGIDLTHPDLNVDTGRSRSFVRNATSPTDQNGHGTHVAGTIAALNNSIGVVGVVPGAPVVSVRVLDRNGSGTNSGVIAGVDYVGANGRAGDVANMSLGGGASDALDTAVRNAAARGIRFVIAAGNSSANANNYSPARVNGTNIYTVSAFGQGDKWASFSNFGNPPIDWAEPGVSIYSTYKSGGYATLSGTSMAAPHLAGLLLLGSVRSGGTVSGDPDGTPDQIGVR
jgi:subtilisin family serine protease